MKESFYVCNCIHWPGVERIWKSIRPWSKLNDGRIRNWNCLPDVHGIQLQDGCPIAIFSCTVCTVWLAVVRAMTGDVPQSKTLLYSTWCKHYDVVCTQIFLSQKDSIVFILILSCSILWHLLMSTSFSRIFEVAPPVLSRVFQELSAGI